MKHHPNSAVEVRIRFRMPIPEPEPQSASASGSGIPIQRLHQLLEPHQPYPSAIRIRNAHPISICIPNQDAGPQLTYGRYPHHEFEYAFTVRIRFRMPNPHLYYRSGSAIRISKPQCASALERIIRLISPYKPRREWRSSIRHPQRILLPHPHPESAFCNPHPHLISGSGIRYPHPGWH